MKCYLHAGLFSSFCCLMLTFFKINIFKKLFTIRMSNSFGHPVGSDLGPNCLQKLSADDKSPLAKKELTLIQPIFFVIKMSSAYFICCIYSNAHQKTFTMAANTMNVDQTAPKAKGAV